jgi:UDP-glucose 4-epimerase
MKKILVTGGVGYVGRELVRQLIQHGGAQIHVLDNLACGEHRLGQMDPAKFVLHRMDIRDGAAVKRLLHGISPEIIFHLAAVHYIPACEEFPGEAAGINVVGTVNLLDAVANGARFVFASTAAVYTPGDDTYTEAADNLGPVDIYGITKLQGERFVRHFHERGGVDGVIVRLFNVIGPGETNPHLVPAIMSQIGRGERRVQLGNLFPQRDYIDVSDAAEGFRRLGTTVRSAGGANEPLVCNLGTGISYAVRDVVAEVGRSARVSLEIVQDPARMRANDRPRLCASTKKLEAITGWSPRKTIAESLQAAWNSRVADGFA